MLKRKKPQHSPSSSPPKGSVIGADHHTHKNNKKDKKNKNNNQISISINNNSNNNNSNKVSNPKKYQKPNSSTNSNELIDHHQHVPLNLLNENNNINENILNNNNINIESNNNNNQSILSKMIIQSLPSPPIENKLAIKDINLDSSSEISLTTPIQSILPTTSQSSSIYVPKYKAPESKPQTLTSQQLSDNIDFIPISSNLTSNQSTPNPNISSNFHNNKLNNNKNQNINNNNLVVPIWLEGIVKGKELLGLSLDSEIESFVDWVSPTVIENRLRQKVIKDVENIIRDLWPKARIIVFGSFVNDLSLPSSDIDIQISNITSDDFNVNSYTYEPIRDLHNSMIRKHQDSFTNCRLISSAKVPIIKMTSINTHFNIDICFNTPNGYENTMMVKSLLNRYKSMRTLLIVIKFFLFQNSLNETYTGGIGSYALALMVVSFIQLRYVPMNLRTLMSTSEARRKYKRDAGNDTDYGKMLLEFFELYGRSFNYSVLGISLEQNGFYYSKVDQWGTSLTLLDPHDRENDVGRNSFNIPFIRGAFTNSLLKIISNDALKERYSNITFSTSLSKIIEERLVEQLAKERAQVIKFGRYLEDAGDLPEIVPIEGLINNPPGDQYLLKKSVKKAENTFISVSSSDESSGNERGTTSNVISLDDDESSDDDEKDDSDCVIISESDSSSDVHSNKSNNSSSRSSCSFSDYSSDSEIESMIESTNSTSPNQCVSSPLSSSDNEDNNSSSSSIKILKDQPLSKYKNQNQIDPYAW